MAFHISHCQFLYLPFTIPPCLLHGIVLCWFFTCTCILQVFPTFYMGNTWFLWLTFCKFSIPFAREVVNSYLSFVSLHRLSLGNYPHVVYLLLTFCKFLLLFAWGLSSICQLSYLTFASSPCLLHGIILYCLWYLYFPFVSIPYLLYGKHFIYLPFLF